MLIKEFVHLVFVAARDDSTRYVTRTQFVEKRDHAVEQDIAHRALLLLKHCSDAASDIRIREIIHYFFQRATFDGGRKIRYTGRQHPVDVIPEFIIDTLGVNQHTVEVKKCSLPCHKSYKS